VEAQPPPEPPLPLDRQTLLPVSQLLLQQSELRLQSAPSPAQAPESPELPPEPPEPLPELPDLPDLPEPPPPPPPPEPPVPPDDANVHVLDVNT
jgi:hypothetical protein